MNDFDEFQNTKIYGTPRSTGEMLNHISREIKIREEANKRIIMTYDEVMALIKSFEDRANSK
jgi:hypothetical protein